MISGVFSALSNQKRLGIIETLDSRNHTVSGLAKKLGSTIQALMPHIEQLEEQGIIFRGAGGVELTGVGTALLQQVDNFEFLSKTRAFFKEHDFDDAGCFENRLGSLKEFEYVEGLSPNVSRWKDIIKNANRHICCIFTEPPILIADEILSKVRNGVMLCLLFGKNSIVTSCNDFVDKLELTKHSTQDIIQRRRTEHVGINLVASENMCSLMFPSLDKRTDMHNSFVSSDGNFLDWCDGFFNYKWNDAEPFSRLKITS